MGNAQRQDLGPGAEALESQGQPGSRGWGRGPCLGQLGGGKPGGAIFFKMMKDQSQKSNGSSQKGAGHRKHPHHESLGHRGARGLGARAQEPGGTLSGPGMLHRTEEAPSSSAPGGNPPGRAVGVGGTPRPVPEAS